MSPPWKVLQTHEVQEWLSEIPPPIRRAVDKKIALLRLYGPQLSRPHVDHIKGSRHSNMKELRITSGGPTRILFCFDSERRAVLLIAGMKSERSNWYDWAINKADALMDEYLNQGN